MTEYIPPEKTSDNKKPNQFGETFRFILLILPWVILFRMFIAQPFVVRGASMEPTFHNNEYLIIYELPYHFQNPARGDVIVFKYPNDTSQHYIKRVIGLPGETIEIQNNQIKIYNEQHPEGFLLEEDYLKDITHGTIKQTLKEDEFYVLGDNRDNSSDSRRWGPLNKKYITGRAILRLWPTGTIKVNPGSLPEFYQEKPE